MGRDFRAALAGERCWDRELDDSFARTERAPYDAILQNREELIGLCEFIEAHHIRSYLEIGVWTGRLVSALHRLFDFDTVATCDIGWATSLGLMVRLPFEARHFAGSSTSPEFARWREALGPIDLVLIDGDHSYEGVRADFEVNRRFPHRFLALHDITGAHASTAGVKQLWDELDGWRHEIVRPHPEAGRDHSTMGIGIWAESD